VADARAITAQFVVRAIVLVVVAAALGARLWVAGLAGAVGGCLYALSAAEDHLPRSVRLVAELTVDAGILVGAWFVVHDLFRGAEAPVVFSLGVVVVVVFELMTLPRRFGTRPPDVP
jgi:uncharacterized membrane protein